MQFEFTAVFKEAPEGGYVAFAEELRRGRYRTQDAAALAANFEWNADVGANAQFNTNTAQLLSIAIDSTGPPRCSS